MIISLTTIGGVLIAVVLFVVVSTTVVIFSDIFTSNFKDYIGIDLVRSVAVLPVHHIHSYTWPYQLNDT